MIKKNLGMSLFEIIVVIALFLVVVGVANQGIFSTIKGSSKSKITIKVKEETEYVVSLMERSIHSARSYVDCTSNSVAYEDENGNGSFFSCSVGARDANGVLTTTGTVSKDGSRLTSDGVNVSACTISCPLEGGYRTVLLNMTLEQAAGGAGLRAEEKSNMQINTRIRFRN